MIYGRISATTRCHDDRLLDFCCSLVHRNRHPYTPMDENHQGIQGREETRPTQRHINVDCGLHRHHLCNSATTCYGSSTLRENDNHPQPTYAYNPLDVPPGRGICLHRTGIYDVRIYRGVEKVK